MATAAAPPLAPQRSVSQLSTASERPKPAAAAAAAVPPPISARPSLSQIPPAPDGAAATAAGAASPPALAAAPSLSQVSAAPDEDREPVLDAIRDVLTRLPEKQLWDVRRMTLAASSQDSSVPVLHFEKALSLGIRSLGKADLVAILTEFRQTEKEISAAVLAPLHHGYATEALSEYFTSDLAKATVKVWELLQVKSRSTRRWLAKQDYERVRWRLSLLSPTLYRTLLSRMVHVSCELKYVVEEIMDAVDRRITATRLAYKLTDQLLLTSRVLPDHPALCSSMPNNWTLLQRLTVVLQLLQLFAPTEAEGGALQVESSHVLVPHESLPPPETLLLP